MPWNAAHLSIGSFEEVDNKKGSKKIKASASKLKGEAPPPSPDFVAKPTPGGPSTWRSKRKTTPGGGYDTPGGYDTSHWRSKRTTPGGLPTTAYHEDPSPVDEGYISICTAAVARCFVGLGAGTAFVASLTVFIVMEHSTNPIQLGIALCVQGIGVISVGFFLIVAGFRMNAPLSMSDDHKHRFECVKKFGAWCYGSALLPIVGAGIASFVEGIRWINSTLLVVVVEKAEEEKKEEGSKEESSKDDDSSKDDSSKDESEDASKDKEEAEEAERRIEATGLFDDGMFGEAPMDFRRLFINGFEVPDLDPEDPEPLFIATSTTECEKVAGGLTVSAGILIFIYAVTTGKLRKIFSHTLISIGLLTIGTFHFVTALTTHRNNRTWAHLMIAVGWAIVTLGWCMKQISKCCSAHGCCRKAELDECYCCYRDTLEKPKEAVTVSKQWVDTEAVL